MFKNIPSPRDKNYYNNVLTQSDNISTCKIDKCNKKLGLYPQFCFIHTLNKNNMYISKSCIPNIGFGLFAGRKGFKKHDVVGKYSSDNNKITFGELLKNHEKHTYERTKYILCSLPKKNQKQKDVMCWDGLDIRSTILRFINDSYKTNYKNNTYFSIKNNEAYVIASDDIPPFHELYISYGNNYWID